MENFTLSAIADAFHFYSTNETFKLPGIYDIKIEDASWALAATLGMFSMRTGSCMIEAGIVGSKNRVNAMMKSLVDMCAGGVCYWLFGFGLMYGRGEFSNGLFGAGDFFLDIDVADPLMAPIYSFFFYQISFATTSTSIVAGAIAERCRFPAYVLISFLFTFIYSVSGGWIWGYHGWLKNIGAVEFSGAGPVHIIGGAASLVAAWWIKPRIGRYDNGLKPLPINDGVIAISGLFMLWFAWLSFNSGSSFGITGGKWEFAARAAVCTTIASISSGFTALIFSMITKKGRTDVGDMINGVLSGLVAINAGCYMFSMFSAAATGIIAALVTLTSRPLVDKLKIDDACGSISLNFISGVWGQLSVGFFADPPTGLRGLFFGGGPNQLIAQAISCVSLTFFSCVSMFILMALVNSIITIRLSPEDELLGCDLVEHHIGTSSSTQVLQKPSTKLDRIIEITTPITKRFTGSVDIKNRRNSECLHQQKQFYTNNGFDMSEKY